MNRIFLLSPANCSGKRAFYLLRDTARFGLALRLREGKASLADVFSFMSGLYFKGKVAYARAFGRHQHAESAALVILPGRGLVPLERIVTVRQLRAVAKVPVDLKVDSYARTLRRDARRLARGLSSQCQVILLGSIATKKYTKVLVPILGVHLHYPAEFEGIGDMSRGALMLRRAASGQELTYVRDRFESDSSRRRKHGRPGFMQVI